MAGVRQKPNQRGKYRAWYFNAQGKRIHITGTRKKIETLNIAQKLEDEHRQIRLGYREIPKSAKKHKNLCCSDVMKEYLSWGESQGGRGGRPWGKTHARNRRRHLPWWENELQLQIMGDLEGILPRVEKTLRQLKANGRAGKTVANYAESLASFCTWCVQRGYLSVDPLERLGTFDTTPQIRRRAMTAEEIARLLEACAPHRRLVLETAFMSGLRANELRQLTLDHLDLKHGGLFLDARWTKNRRDDYQKLPLDLVERLKQLGASGEVARLYAKFYGRKDATIEAPANPLLYVPSHTARDLDIDLKAADIPKHTSAGKIDFHACRVAYINFVIQTGRASFSGVPNAHSAKPLAYRTSRWSKSLGY